MTNTKRTTCRNCGSAQLIELFSLGNHLVNDFPESPTAEGHRCPIDIVMCGSCSLVQQLWTAPAEMLWSNQYWYKSGVNESMKAALGEVALEVLKRVEPSPGDAALDIGSNDGTFLHWLPKDMLRIGVEPAENLATAENYQDLKLVKGYWGRLTAYILTRALAPRGVKIVTALGMLYDLEDPGEFISDIADILHTEGVFVVQLTCLKQTVVNNDVGNLCHEHLEFYSLAVLEKLLAKYRLRIFRVEENDVNGGSYRIWATKNNSVVRCPSVDRHLHIEREMGLDNPEKIREWWVGVEKIKEKIKKALEPFGAVWAYGASTKGNTILQWLDINGWFSGVADRSPEKHGRHTVTGIPIRSEEEFRKSGAEVALVLPWGFWRSFVGRERDWLENGGSFLLPFPKPVLLSVRGAGAVMEKYL